MCPVRKRNWKGKVAENGIIRLHSALWCRCTVPRKSSEQNDNKRYATELSSLELILADATEDHSVEETLTNQGFLTERLLENAETIAADARSTIYTLRKMPELRRIPIRHYPMQGENILACWIMMMYWHRMLCMRWQMLLPKQMTEVSELHSLIRMKTNATGWDKILRSQP